LTADASVAPKYTLDTVEAIVRHANVRIEGMSLTLKLSDWNLAADILGFQKRIRSSDYANVHSRQLVFDRREICDVTTELSQIPTV
jgi:23S rRNA (cytidine2498-2'-O)-methyltransferase